MIDKDKVLMGIGQHINGSMWDRCGDCPYYSPDAGGITCRDALLEDLYELIDTQEPRVMAWRDVIGAALECKSVYIEVRDNEDKESGDDRWAMVTQYKDSMTNGMIRAMSSYVTSEILFADRYNKGWRCWTSRPTDEQREATPWW